MSDYEDASFLATLPVDQLEDEMSFLTEHIAKLQMTFEPGHRLIVLALCHRVSVNKALEEKRGAA